MEFKVGDKLRANVNGIHHTGGNTYEVLSVQDGQEGLEVTIMCDRGSATFDDVTVKGFFKRIDEPQADRSEPQPQVMKVKLTQGQADAIKRLIETGWDAEEIINEHHIPWAKELEVLNNLSTADVARVLLIGYDVEQTAEEKVLVAYEAAERMLNAESRKDEKSYESGFWWGKINGMKSVLDAYGVKVKGIND